MIAALAGFGLLMLLLGLIKAWLVFIEWRERPHEVPALVRAPAHPKVCEVCQVYPAVFDYGTCCGPSCAMTKRGF